MNEAENSPKISPVIYVLMAVLLWSTGGLFIKMTTLDAFAVNGGRSLFAAVTVAIDPACSLEGFPAPGAAPAGRG